jgi:hypothetical protein
VVYGIYPWCRGIPHHKSYSKLSDHPPSLLAANCQIGDSCSFLVSRFMISPYSSRGFRILSKNEARMATAEVHLILRNCAHERKLMADHSIHLIFPPPPDADSLPEYDQLVKATIPARDCCNFIGTRRSANRRRRRAGMHACLASEHFSQMGRKQHPIWERLRGGRHLLRRRNEHPPANSSNAWQLPLFFFEKSSSRLPQFHSVSSQAPIAQPPFVLLSCLGGASDQSL